MSAAREMLGEMAESARATRMVARSTSQVRRRRGVRARLAGRAREALSWLAVARVVPAPARPRGISAIVRLRDEETWLEPSIGSIATVADEIVVADNGSRDRSPEILASLRTELGDRLVVRRWPDLGIRDLTNALIAETRFRWVVRWDADFVARTDGNCSVERLREWLDGLDPRRHAFAYLRMIEVCGDLFHQRPGTPSRADCHAFTPSSPLRYVYGRGGYEAPRLPPWYRVLRFETPTFFHVDVKPTRRMFLSWLWKRYLTGPGGAGVTDFDAWVARELARAWDGMTVDEAARRWSLGVMRELVPYDRERFGDHPARLKPHLDAPAFRLVYRDGRIVGRTEP